MRYTNWMYAHPDPQGGADETTPQWASDLEQDENLRRLVLSTAGSALRRGLLFTSRRSWGIATYADRGELDTAQGDGEAPSFWTRVPLIKGLARFARQLRMKRSAKRAIAGKAPADTRGPVRRVLTALASVLVYLLAVSVFYNMLDWTAAQALAASSWAGPARVPIATVLTLAFISVGFVLLLGVPRLWEAGRERWKFHGAEHKVVAAFEQLGPRWREGIRGAQKEHRRCGTNYLFLLIASLGFLSVALLAAGAPEDYRLAAFLFGIPALDASLVWLIQRPRVGQVISAPGLWLQRINTIEPEKRHLRAAVEAATPVVEEILLDYEAGRGTEQAVPRESVRR